MAGVLKMVVVVAAMEVVVAVVVLKLVVVFEATGVRHHLEKKSLKIQD